MKTSFLTAVVLSLVCSDVTHGDDSWPKLAFRDQQRRMTSINLTDRAETAPAPAPIQQKGVVKVDTRRPYRVVLDPGHGGKDLGARGPNGLLEKHLCLQIAQRVRSQLHRQAKLLDIPMEIQLTRENDNYLSLQERVRVANQSEADIFLSVHANSSPHTRARGFEVYFLSNEASDAEARSLALLENGGETALTIKPHVLSILSDVQKNKHVTESFGFAEIVFQALSRKLRSNGRGVRQAPFTVLAGTEMPAVLLEVGYVTHPEEASALSRLSYLKRLASAISNGIVEFILHKRKIG